MNIKEFSKLAGVSVSTVSKIMNNKDENISVQTREHVLTLAKKYDYKPYSFVQNQYGNKSNILGVIFRDCIPDDRLLKGLMNKARSHGYGITILESHKNIQQELKNLSILTASSVDGILLNPLEKKLSPEIQNQLVHSKKPYLLFRTEEKKDEKGFLPTLSYKEMAIYLTQQLLDKGHFHIAFVADENSSFYSAFKEGFKSCLFHNEVNVSEDNFFSQDNEQFYRLLSMGMFTAVITMHFQSCLRIFQRLTNRHFQIPRDISLVTLCKHENNLHNFSEISSLLIPFESLGEYLADSIIRFMEANERHSEKVQRKFSPIYSLNHMHSIDIPSLAKKKKMTILGSINADSYLFFHELPEPGVTVRTTRAASYLGGKAMNQAIGVCNLGLNASIVGLVGDDVEADILYENAKQKRVDTHYLQRVTDKKTGKGYIFLNESGESMISILSGANECVSPDYIKNSTLAFQGSSLCLINTEIPEDAVFTACQIAKENGIPVILKPSSIAHLNPKILSLVDILVPNLEETDVLLSNYAKELSEKIQKNTNAELPDENVLEACAAYFLQLGVGMVILTLGKNGLIVKSNALYKKYEAHKVNSIDTTGAADAFISAFASYLLMDFSLDSAIRIGIYAAALSTTKEGAAPSLVDRNTLESYIAKENPELLSKKKTDQSSFTLLRQN